MTSTVYPSIYNVRTHDDFNVLQEDALERYNVPENWLILELLGLSSIVEIINKPDDTFKPTTSVLPKRPSLIDDIAVKSVPLFLRL